MFSAISLGVFCRLAPSTRAIIRSMKLSPGFCVILTTMRSDSTVVPPVTAERSPPDSRMTGADSPVIADSSTEAMPSTTSPSPGIVWPASTTTMSPCCSSGAATSSSRPGAPGVQPTRRRAMVAVLVLRNDSAWALPRPSATASARLAKITVSHSQTTISQANQDGSTMARTVLHAAPISTMNMTGLRHSVRGLSLRSASGIDFHSIFGSSRPPWTRLVLLGFGCATGSESMVGADISEFLQRAARARAWAGRSGRPGSTSRRRPCRRTAVGGWAGFRWIPASCPVWQASRPVRARR